MVLFPDVQKRIQAELDAVVGRKRLPTFEDRASLPYLEATIKESLRFHPPTPLGIAHRLSEDDVVQGTVSHSSVDRYITHLCTHRPPYPEGVHRSSEYLGDEHE
jgi:cytochrome P450